MSRAAELSVNALSIMHMFNKQQLIGAAGGAMTVALLGAAALSFAQTSTSTTSASTPAHPQGVAGTVTAVNGSTITLSGKNGTTYTVNAGSAAITKDETVSVSDVAVGDTLMAQGSVDGTSVTATSIHDGQMPQGGPRGGGPGMGMGVRGTVSAVSGTTLTVTATNPKDNTTSIYTVDASNATVMLAPATAGSKPATGSLSSVKTGDTVMVAGTVSGSTVTAKMIMDGQFPKPQWNGKKSSTTTSNSATSTQ